MQHHIKEYYKQSSGDTGKGKFHKVIHINEANELLWEEIQELAPSLPRGWFELAHLKPSDRLEFTRDFWIAKLPYHPPLQEFLTKFFQSLEDIYIFLVQQKFDDPFDAHLVYGLKKDAGFYKGHPPILEKDVLHLKAEFSEIIFPKDYIAFLQIHDGFCKTTDCTGVFKSTSIKSTYERLQESIAKLEKETTGANGVSINPLSLIPFYESFGMPFFQCFFKDWYPEDEMGNVYYSGNNNTISDIKSSETMAFPTFSDWLIFYLETIS